MKVKKLIKKLSKNTMVSYGDTGGNFLCNRRVGEYADYGFEEYHVEKIWLSTLSSGEPKINITISK